MQISNQLLVAAFVRRLSPRPRKSLLFPLIRAMRHVPRLVICLRQALLSLLPVRFNSIHHITDLNYFRSAFGPLPFALLIRDVNELLNPLFPALFPFNQLIEFILSNPFTFPNVSPFHIL
ncbi:hypothetical protein RCL1_000719 [Eukaryota sp. TZLM3-RCL]